MKAELGNIHQNGMKGIALIRHVIAAVLFEHVLDRFAFGFTRRQSDFFEQMEIDLFATGSPPLPSRY